MLKYGTNSENSVRSHLLIDWMFLKLISISLINFIVFVQVASALTLSYGAVKGIYINHIILHW